MYFTVKYLTKAFKLYWLLISALIACSTVNFCSAQELTPRRWSHIPINTNVLGVGYTYTRGDISFDPALSVENAKLDMSTIVLRYIRSFELLGKTARAEIMPGFQSARWKGLLNGEPATANRNGLTDPVIRFAVNLIGAPPLEKKKYAHYRAGVEKETIAGAALAVHLPLGQYFEDKLLNLGQNRFIFRPQIGAVRQWGPWSIELTGSVWIFTDNNDFYNESERQQDPLLTVQSQVVYDIQPRLWIAGSVGYGSGGESSINGVNKGDDIGNAVWALNFGFPIVRQLAGKVAYVGGSTRKATGSDSHSFVFSLVTSW